MFRAFNMRQLPVSMKNNDGVTNAEDVQFLVNKSPQKRGLYCLHGL